MKRSSLIFVAFIFMTMHSACIFADSDLMVTASKLPEEARAFVGDYFSSASISYIKKDINFLDMEYEVLLSDGTKIDFDRKGRWEKVSCKTRTIPSALVPKEISRYIKSTYPKERIVKINKENYGYDIKLSNSMELSFNKSGQFISINY